MYYRFFLVSLYYGIVFLIYINYLPTLKSCFVNMNFLHFKGSNGMKQSWHDLARCLHSNIMDNGFLI